ncbi:MAG TPA: cyclase family protein [Gemmatimonadales bacterium]
MRALVCLALGLAACGTQPRPDLLTAGTWVDLSHDFSAETIYWPTARPFSLEVVSAERTPAGYYYAANNFAGAEHGGTHLDAPVHFAEGRHTSDQIPLERLVGPAAVVDVSAEAGADRDYRMDVAVLEAWEAAHGPIGEQTIVLVRTGWSERWPDKARYLGTARSGPEAVAELHFPGIDSSAARWLAGRQVKAVGIDTPSIDHGQSTTFDTHRILFAQNVPAFENVTNLDRLPPTGGFVIALPMKIRGGSGGPLRIAAVIPSEPTE